jgi:hypothetical protein
MSQSELRSLIALLTWLPLYAGFAVYLKSQIAWAGLDTGEAMRSFAQAALAVVAIAILLAIVLEIGGSILYAIISGEAQPALSDERDQLMELKSMQAGSVAFGLAFLAVLAGLAFGWLQPLGAIMALFFALAASQVFAVAFKLALYRLGA